MSRGDYDRRDEPRGDYRDRYDDRDDRGGYSRRDDGGQRRGTNIAGRRPGSRHGMRRKEWGNWDGHVNSIPGRINGDDTPDMRDPVNREAFLGEDINTRRDQALQNLRGDRRADQPRSRRDDQPRQQQHGMNFQIAPRDLEDMNDDELLALGEQINNVEYHLLKEMKHRDRSSGRHSQDRRDEPRGRQDDRRDYQPASSEERRERREQYADDPNVPRNQDGSPDLRSREAGGGNQGQGRVADPRDDDRLVQNRDGRGRDFDDRDRRDERPMRSRRD